MSTQKVWPVELDTYEDPISGATVHQLTKYRCNSYHLYFTSNGWYDEGRRLLFVSERNNRVNLFSAELASGELTQLTDVDAEGGSAEMLTTAPNWKRNEVYFIQGNNLMAAELATGAVRSLYPAADGFRCGSYSATADGRFVCMAETEERPEIRKGPGYEGFHEMEKARPLCRIKKISVDGSGAETVWEEQRWITHVNTSPVLPNITTFCHEGPWTVVDHRIWVLDIDTGSAHKVRERTHPQEAIGHEYWHADGIHIGYHGHHPELGKLFGCMKHDGSDPREVQFPHHTGHIHSNDYSMIVGDGQKGTIWVRLWKWNGTDFDGPKVLCRHRSSFHTQIAHVHPRFSPDGTKVDYTSDTLGYCNVYVAEVPEFDSLPDLEDVDPNENRRV